MDIPNYDSGEKSNNGFKQLYKYMPKNTFRMLMAGYSGLGKTNLLSHILQYPLTYYGQIHLYAKNLDQDKYMNLIDKMNGISEQVGYPVLMASNDEIIPVNQLQDTDMQRVIIFDDYVCEKVQKPLIDYFIQGRHKNCSVIYLTQSFYGCPKAIRLNCSHFCLYDFPSSRERNLISQELGIDKEKYIKATNKPYSFCYVDKPMKTGKRNFMEYIIYLYMGVFNDNSENDHFGHFKFSAERGPPGPQGPKGQPGVGYKLTSGGNFDIDGKRLTDVADSIDDGDVVNLKVLKENTQVSQNNYHLQPSFRFYKEFGDNSQFTVGSPPNTSSNHFFQGEACSSIKMKGNQLDSGSYTSIFEIFVIGDAGGFLVDDTIIYHVYGDSHYTINTFDSDKIDSQYTKAINQFTTDGGAGVHNGIKFQIRYFGSHYNKNLRFLFY